METKETFTRLYNDNHRYHDDVFDDDSDNIYDYAADDNDGDLNLCH